MSDRKAIKYAIPVGAPVSMCKGCGAMMAWVVTKAQQSMPVDADGTPHWATCPKAISFRKPRK